MRSKFVAITVAGLVLAAVPAEATPTASDARLTAEVVDEYMVGAVESTGLPGASVVVTHEDEVVHAAGYGHDPEGAEITGDTPMRVASLSKSFTAMAVLQLVEDGELVLDDPVVQHLPEFSMADPRAAEITVRQLLNQTSGIADSGVEISGLSDAASLREYVSRLGSADLVADPGSEWAYCNVNYNLAARLVEVLSGQEFGDYLRQQVFDPLGMDHSAVGNGDIRSADGYNSVFGVWVPRAELSGFRGGGSGSVVASAADMGQWLITQNGRGTQLVEPQSLATMDTPTEVRDYGMGWHPDTVNTDSEMLVHGGNLFTSSAVQGIVPESGYGFAILTNSAALYDDTYDIMRGLVALSEGESPDAPGGARQLTDSVLGLVAVVAAGLGVSGVLRSGRWAEKRAGHRAWRIALRFVPALLPVTLLAGYPSLISFITNGREITWDQLTYFAAPVTITVVVAAVAGAASVAARLARLRSVWASG